MNTSGDHKAHKSVTKPIVSVITVVYNGQESIERSIQSVITQTYNNLEYIIVDGGSTDGTLDIIRNYTDKIHYWVSEPDRGIYDAMNKGISLAKGDWLYFLGSDDTLIDPNVFEMVFDSNPSSASIDVIFGDVIYESGHVFVSRFDSRLLFGNTIHHQAAFYNARVFENFRYDSGFSVSADYELNLRLFLFGAATRRVPIVIARCGDAGASGRASLQGYTEEILARRRQLGWWRSIKYDALTLARCVGKKIIWGGMKCLAW